MAAADDDGATATGRRRRARARPAHPRGAAQLRRRRYVFSTDHKVIAKQFLWLGLGFLAVGGSMAMLIRWQLANPGAPFPLIGSCCSGHPAA